MLLRSECRDTSPPAHARHDPIAVGFTQLWTLTLETSGARPLPHPIAPLNRVEHVAEFELPRECLQVCTTSRGCWNTTPDFYEFVASPTQHLCVWTT